MRTPDNRARLYVALVHYPVVNRNGDTIASAITNLDLHDLGRLTCTFGIPACYIVTPLLDQQALARKVLSHWIDGVGKRLHPDRELALKRLHVVDSIESARREIETEWGERPRIWATTASGQDARLAIRRARKLLTDENGTQLLLFGTGWGLAPRVLEQADAVLEPIQGMNGYNHLSVRCAAAILLDRLLAEER